MLNLSSYRIDKHIDDSKLNTLKTLKTPSAGKVFAKWMMGFFGVFFIVLFIPWQQNIRGEGLVTAFNPANRPQSIETAIPGRISSWRVREGQYVQRGDTILTLSEVKDDYFDPMLLERLQEQIDAKEGSIESKENKVKALRARINALQEGRRVKLQQAKNKLLQSKFKLISDSIDFEAEKIRYLNFTSQFERNKELFEAGNIALTKYQDIESKFQESRMKQISAENKFLESQAEVINSRVGITGVEADYADKINKAESDLNTTLSSLFEAEAEISKMRNKYANVTIRTDNYQVIAPQNGYIVQATLAGIGETVKEGEGLVTIMPSNKDIAVEMYVKAMDVPLISKGREVRIQFDGWPALQFSGWPSVSVGTFGGIVRVIDRVNSKKNGKFRILITPDPNDEPWPNQLRVGSGTKGWVMLDNVPVWYEIWRQLNGFPPSIYEEPFGEKEVIAKGK
ncbi:MAG: HlyD family efflux transporter periplasmic adaptor subunit [Bacteroidota bacterium]